MSLIFNRGFVRSACALLVFACAFAAPPSTARASTPLRVALLDARIINDNEGLDPLSAAELARIRNVGDQLKAALVASGKFTNVPVPPGVKTAIDKGQFIGECGGCEVEYGKKLGADRIAWVTVQKISNLILNLNVYMADVETNRMTFLKSVDIRGNTDESWSRSMAYLLKNHLLVDAPQSGSVPPVSH
ncbi:MAG: DUF3280 domain-containing protein [Hyphomicrobium sp.]